MRIGVQLPEVEREVRWPEVAAIAQAAERAGYDSIWLGDHMLYREGARERGPWDVWTQLAGLAALTSRVTLGPLVAATAFHPPATLARLAASIDEISGGRFVLGLGAGWNETELRAFGHPSDRLASRFAESFGLVRRLLAGEHVTFAGSFYRLEDAVLLPKPARRIPLMVGSVGPRVLAAALPHVDAWNGWYVDHRNSVAGYRELHARIDAACRAAGRDPRAVERSACVLVAFGSGGERRHDAPPVRPDDLSAFLQDLAAAGADEAILVIDPITERSVGQLAERVL